MTSVNEANKQRRNQKEVLPRFNKARIKIHRLQDPLISLLKFCKRAGLKFFKKD